MTTPGQIIAGKYEVERVLGAGGMGVVVAAKHIHLGQRVAIKFMRIEATADPNAVNRFVREARAAAALTSERVARVLDVATLDSGEPYMVMEYLAGVDLAEVVRSGGPMAIPDAIGAVLQACEAIAEAHAVGIVHRDLKPSNLFVTKRRDGVPLVKVLDFGISKTVQLNTSTTGSQENLTASGLVMGSPGYMSPEQLRSAKAADARSDIWSLGVILYELLTAKPPFTGETMGETFARIISEPPPPIRKERPEVPEALAAVIMQCLERDVNRRIQTVGELATKLTPFGPRDASTSLDRIRRMSSSAVSSSPASSSGPNTMTALPFSGSDSVPSGGANETGPAWLRSGTSQYQDFRRRPAILWLTIAVVGVAAAIVIAGVYTVAGMRADSTTKTVASTSTPSTEPAASTVTAPVQLAPVHTATAEVIPPLPREEVSDNSPAEDAGIVRRQRPVPAAVAPGAAKPIRPGTAKPPGHDPLVDDLLDRRQ